MITCMFCEDYQPKRGDPIPRCFINGGGCHGFDNGCSCAACAQRWETERFVGFDLRTEERKEN